MADLMQRLEQHADAYSLLGEKDLPALLREAAAALRTAPDGWVKAVERELVCVEIGVANADDSEEVASGKLRELIDWHVAVATDPTLNGGLALVPVDEVKDAP